MLDMPTIPKTVRDQWLPRQQQPIVQWVKDNIYLPESLRSVSQRFSDFHFPYQKAVLETIDDDDYREVSLLFGTQLGKTFTVSTALLYLAANLPGPSMLVNPTEKANKVFLKTRLYPSIKSCPPLKDQLLPEHKRSVELVELADMVIYIAHSGSVDSLGGKTCKYVVLSEVDKFSRKHTTEADPLKLAYERTKAFHGTQKILVEGTPTIKGISRIDKIYQNSDRRRYHVPCPHCGAYQILILHQIKGGTDDDGNTRTPDEAKACAYYECIECEAHLHDHQKMEMIRRGQWVRDGQHVKTNGIIGGTPKNPCDRAGFHLSSIYSNAISFGDVLYEFFTATKAGKAQLQNFFNSWMAEAWEDKITETNAKKLRQLALNYSAGSVPKGVRFLVGSVDVQLDHFWALIRGWGYDEESWLILTAKLYSWAEVEKMFFKTRYPVVDSDETMPVFMTGIDSRYRTPQVFKFCRTHLKHSRPVMGAGTGFGRYQRKYLDKDAAGKINPAGLQRILVDTVFYKDKIADFANVKEGEVGSWHLHFDPSKNYIGQATSEHKVVIPNRRGEDTYAWRKKEGSPQNHFWDCEVYGACMADLIGIPSMTPPESNPVNIHQPREQTPQQKRERPW